MLTIDKEIIQKFDVAGPRYTSYPTAPEWTNALTKATYEDKLRIFGQSLTPLSLYVHIPFCRSLCYFCACNVLIRPNDEKYGDEYLGYLFKEMDLVAQSMGGRKKIKQMHWGGGTPTYLSEAQLERLFKKITASFDLDPRAEIAVEIDPRTIDRNKLEKLRSLGFNRVSMGIQDFDEAVQKEVYRIQPFEKVQAFYQWCRELGFRSINFDLIYGLPNQTPHQFASTVEKVIDLRPDRIALYSFAYVPWIKKQQRKLLFENLPTNSQKLDIFLQARRLFLEHGYEAIAMDHFALREDELARAFEQGHLYRNFMGYTVRPADEFVGLGLSSISFVEKTFIQNYKTIHEYYDSLKRNELPVERGKELTVDDQIRQWTIDRLMCRFEVKKREFKTEFGCEFDQYFAEEQSHIAYCLAEGLIETSHDYCRVTDFGKLFVRNICMGFDWYLRQGKTSRRFSQTV